MILRGIILFLMALNKDRASVNPNPLKLEVSVKAAQVGIHCRPGQIHFGKMPQTPQGNLGLKVSAHKFFSEGFPLALISPI